MVPVRKDVLLASADQVAIDAVAAKLMGFDPLSIRYLALAHERGLGVADPRDIELVGQPEIGQRELGLLGRRQPRQPGRRPALVRAPEAAAEALLPHAAGVPLRRRLVPLPRLPLVPGRSARRRVREFVRTSPWGALFARYLREQASAEAVGTRRCRDGLGHAPRLMGGR